MIAHGVGVRADLPIPIWLFVDAAGVALVVSFLLLGFRWRTARLMAAADGSSLGLPRVVRLVWSVLLRMIGLAVLVLVAAAALFGSESSASNPAPLWFYVVFWVGLQVASFVVGDIWRALSPFDTLAALGQKARGQALDRTPEAPEPDPEASLIHSNWPALVGIGGFLWLELAYHTPDSPRVLGWAMVGYAVAMLAAAARWGRSWLRTGEGFTVLFGLIAAMAPVRVVDGRLRLRAPFAGLAILERRRGRLAVIVVVLGGTAFDGFSRTSLWKDVIAESSGWQLTLLDTIGLVWLVFVVTVCWVIASRVSARLVGREPSDPYEVERYSVALVPIVLAYVIAHYFSLLWFETQTAIAQISDPFAREADLFGTVGWQPDYASLSPDLIAYVQVAAIVVGHIAGVMVAHDQAVGELDHRQAVRSQYPFLAVMVGYTVAGLLLLLNA